MIVVILKCEEIKIRESYSNTKPVIKNSITSYFTYKYGVSDSQDGAAVAVFSNQEKKYSLPRENIWRITHTLHYYWKKKYFFFDSYIALHTHSAKAPSSKIQNWKYNVHKIQCMRNYFLRHVHMRTQHIMDTPQNQYIIIYCYKVATPNAH